MATTTVDIVVYGGGFAGVAAAAKAAANTASNKTIALIVPDPVDHNGNGSCLGSIGTIGGQNYFDIRKDANEELVTKGTYNWWHTKLGQHYSVDEMAALLKADLAKYGSKIKYYYGYDISSVGWDSRITSLTVKQIKRNPTTGIVEWETVEHTINGTVFIDASESGRLTRRANFGGTTGRFDFPATYLDADEKTNYGKGRQQVATLMFKVTNIDKYATEPKPDDPGQTKNVCINHPNQVWSGAGGDYAYKHNAKILKFNNTHGPKGFALKPFNMAQDGPNSSEWWVNMLLVFNVDGRAYNRDKGTYLFPSDMRSDYKTVDDAWVEARNIINSAEFLDTIKEFPGFRNVQIVKKNGKPVVGEVILHLPPEQGVVPPGPGGFCAGRVIEVHGVPLDLPHQHEVPGACPQPRTHAGDHQVALGNLPLGLGVEAAVGVAIQAAPVHLPAGQPIPGRRRGEVAVIGPLVWGLIAVGQGPGALRGRGDLGVCPGGQDHGHGRGAASRGPDGGLLPPGRVVLGGPPGIGL